jgi:UDP-2,3-diacylglucosamine pyrophosphatase LpxH
MLTEFIYKRRISQVYRTSEFLPIDNGSKIVMMSDVHRGTGSLADDFAKNQIIYSAALKHYNRQKYTYIELGDGDELWKNKKLSEIVAVHGDVFTLLGQFAREHRLYMLWGNHDIAKKYRSKQIDTYFGVESKNSPFTDTPIVEGLILKNSRPEGRILLIHGHQTDFLNDTLWRLAKFLVNHLWKPLELVGLEDPTSAAKNNKVKEKIEMRLAAWAEDRHIPVIAGHTHRAVFPEPGEGRYFNDGCCVHNWSITALEIEQGLISLVKWGEKTRDDGTMYIGRDIIAGPQDIGLYLT